MDRPLQKSVIIRRRAIFIGSGVAVITLALMLVFWLRASAAVSSVRVEGSALSIGTVARGTLHDFIPLRVTVVPQDIVLVDASEGGRVEKVFVRPGDVVDVDQPLVGLSNTQLELQVTAQQAHLSESITQLQNYQTTLEQSRLANEMALSDIEYQIKRLARLLDRSSALAVQGLVSKQSVDELRDELDSYRRKLPLQMDSNKEQAELRRKQLPQISAQIEALQHDLRLTRTKLDSLTVRAPYRGRVTSVDLKIGQTLRQGDRLVEITLDTGFKLTQEVDEFYLTRVQTGQQGMIEVNGERCPVRVSHVFPEIRNGFFRIDLEFVGRAPPNLVQGRTMHGRLFFSEGMETVYMPTGPYLEQTGGRWVFVLNEDGRIAEKRPVRTGRRNSEQIEVLSGVVPGDRILTSDYTGLENSDRVVVE